MTNYDANNPFAGGNPPQNNDGFGQNNNGYGQADQGYGQAGSAYGQGGHDNQGYGQPNQGYQAFPNAEHQNNIGMQQGGMQYPGVGSRFVAYFIDGVVSSIVTMLIFFLFFYRDFADALAAGDQGATTKYTIIISLVTLVIWYAYRVPMEAKFGGSLAVWQLAQRSLLPTVSPLISLPLQSAMLSFCWPPSRTSFHSSAACWAWPFTLQLVLPSASHPTSSHSLTSSPTRSSSASNRSTGTVGSFLAPPNKPL